MLASERWANAFIEQMECVKCRTKENLILYGYDKKPIDLREVTVDDLKRRLARIDVWCTNCAPKVNRLVQGNPRQETKAIAAQLADLAIGSNTEASYDEFLVKGRLIKRADIISYAKLGACQCCGQQFPKEVKHFHHIDPLTKVKNIASMNYTHWSIEELLTEIQKCVIVCANCHALIEWRYHPTPKETIVVDDAFWKGLFEAKELNLL